MEAVRYTVRLAPGEWDGVGLFFEVGMVLDPEAYKPAYSVSGALEVPGVVVSHHRQIQDTVKRQAVEAWQLIQKLQDRGQFPLIIEVQESRVLQVLAGDQPSIKSPDLCQLKT